MGKSLVIILVIILLIGGGVYFLISSGKIPTPLIKNKQTQPQPQSLGEQLYTQTKNPIKDKIPETNPFKVETNPIKAIYPNPFR